MLSGRSASSTRCVKEMDSKSFASLELAEQRMAFKEGSLVIRRMANACQNVGITGWDCQDVIHQEFNSNASRLTNCTCFLAWIGPLSLQIPAAFDASGSIESRSSIANFLALQKITLSERKVLLWFHSFPLPSELTLQCPVPYVL